MYIQNSFNVTYTLCYCSVVAKFLTTIIVFVVQSQRSYEISNIAEFAVSVRVLNALSSVLGSG